MKMIIHARINDMDLYFKTAEELFSPRNIDRGTLAMLSAVEFREGDRVLDLGCGYGVVGIYAAKLIGPKNVVLVDIDRQAVEISRENAVLNGVQDIRIVQSDAFDGIADNDFTMILANPPYHADFSVPKRFIEKGFSRLRTDGRMYMVTKRRDWYKNKFLSVFGGVRIWDMDGYYVFMSEKRVRTDKRKT